MKTNLELYKVFYYVAKNKSITQASNELMVSQPAVSKSIKVLERDLNTELFNRNKDGVSLTNAGEILNNKINKAMELIISGEEDIDSLNNLEQGTINIGAGNTIMQRFLMPYIKEFHEIYPNINVIVHTVVTEELIKRAQVGLVDIVFTHLPNDIPNTYSVYVGKNENGIGYVGITKRNPEIRIGEHLRSNSIRNSLSYSTIKGTGNYSSIRAHILEQKIINYYKLQKNGGLLYNKINSLAPKKWPLYQIK